MNSDDPAATGDEIVYEWKDTIRAYHSGRVQRLCPINFVPPSLDHTTGVQSKDVTINSSTGLSARVYLPPSIDGDNERKLPVLIYYHGGGFCIESAFSPHYHNYLNLLTAAADIVAVSINYRLAPEHLLPAAYDDSWDAFQWVASHSSSSDSGQDPWLSKFGNTEKIFLAGDSAGGNIVHHMGLRLGAAGMKVEGLVLIHPYFWGKEKFKTEEEEKEGAIVKAEDPEGIWRIVCSGKKELDDPWINPFAVGAPSLVVLGCRRALVTTAGQDLMRERGRVYYEKLKESGWGGEVEFNEAEGEDHVFYLFDRNTEKAQELTQLLANFFNK
ncbi:putative carboxylesterase 2 [Apostasia shenzhenica]|uniref:Putative carboxylesterase 2 n=1 Tax=Apostasia shenzhenica TaxID=1088818 RepID=A0A2I0A1R5_9ASPA|nr:putative carboxylesterase 2 [Apostasia shenzhenica]